VSLKYDEMTDEVDITTVLINVSRKASIYLIVTDTEIQFEILTVDEFTNSPSNLTSSDK